MYKSFASRRTEFLVLMLALFAAFLPCSLSARAQDGLFVVPDISVDVSAENAIKAREQAFAEAQVEAFKVLASRMMPESEAEGFTPPDASVISGMISDFEVTKEQLSSTRYVGTYTFTFDDSAVRSFFGARNVTYSDVKSRPVLVLPFIEAGNATQLWSPFNLWMKAWSRAKNLQSGLVPLIVPLGDLDDAQDVGDSEAFRFDPSKLGRMLKRYEAGDAVMAVASLSTPLTVESKDEDPAQGVLTIRLYRTDHGGAEMTQELTLSAGEGQSWGVLFDQGVANARSALQSDWKAKTAVKRSEIMSVQAKAPISSLNQWTATKRALDNVYGLENLKVASITPQYADLSFTFRGDEARLREALAAAGLVLVSGEPVYAPGSMPGSMPLPGNHEIYLREFAPPSALEPDPASVQPRNLPGVMAPPLPDYQNLQYYRARQADQVQQMQQRQQGQNEAPTAPVETPAPYQQRF
ncbi:MAG: DUF2066 domain-containing protein [Alphaproteobacteria bacterium]|nr:DUF2066 domain-containing protein [Alphaproteobacteria bacterium]